MEQLDLIIKNGDVFLDGRTINADLHIKDGKIISIVMPNTSESFSKKVINAQGKLVLPGTVDPHVHVRAPGYEEREDFLSGTMAAANGGVTTMIEHPIANPPQYCLEILERRIAAAKESAIVDFAFYGAAGSEFPDKIMELAASGKIVAFKTFLHEAPMNRESEFLGLVMKDAGEQYEGMKQIYKSGKICAVHAENNAMIHVGIKKMIEAGRIQGKAHADSRPPITEYETVSKLLLFAESTGARIEFCHVSTPEAMEMIKQGKAKGLDVYAETCPHYLLMDDSFLESYGPYAKCNPPLRDKMRVERMWGYVNDGTVDFIGSDHAPYTYEEKKKGEKNIFQCPAGIPCIEMRLPLMLNAVSQGKLSLAKMVELLCTNPAKTFGLSHRKGSIQVGADADIILVDPKEPYTVKTSDMYTKCRDSAKIFDGMKLTGRLKASIVRGRIVMENGNVSEENKGYGNLICPL
ncbi:allantoinase AllB [Sinanaerobacter sp. ZZT-01]|uniref:allantoinase AllB n=1 Tax=Sinanaerobacter sp. ZZT-01 TaxID=3111540 RepID=UPI002D787A2B|nr:allantoinase AllB [Sinanaerobacter sp. ZZT-01]WRR94588.1 allantoinase AllB [Sinanaerobacter sp. ZZT-01]